MDIVTIDYATGLLFLGRRYALTISDRKKEADRKYAKIKL